MTDPSAEQTVDDADEPTVDDADEPMTSDGDETTVSAAGPSTDCDVDATTGDAAESTTTDDTAESTGTDDAGIAESADSTGLGRWRSREVEVPMRVYKTVTVFATLIAVVSVLVGFVLLDAATDRATLPLSEVDAVVALVGIAAMVLGAGTYAFSTRFRATGMGKPNTDGGQFEDDE